MAIDFSDTASSQSEKKTGRPFASFKFSMGGKLTANHRKFFTEQLALLIETGNTLHGSLEMLASQSDHDELKAMINDLHDKVTKGKTFSQALRRHKDLFSPTYITLVDAGEQGGYLVTVLGHLLEMEEKREELRSMMVSAFTYPVILTVFSIAVVIFVLTSIFPKFTVLFSSSGTDLPTITQLLMTASDFLLNYWWVLLSVIVMLGLYLKMLLSQPVFRSRLDHTLLTSPVIGTLLIRLYLTHMMRLLSLSLENGVNLVDALIICKDATGNRSFQKFVEKLVSNVSEGKGLGVGFRETKFIPQLIKQMIQTGEESGKLPLVTGRIADYYQKELAKKLSMLSKIIEPAMLLLMGVFVALIVSALILPIFKLSSTMH